MMSPRWGCCVCTPSEAEVCTPSEAECLYPERSRVYPERSRVLYPERSRVLYPERSRGVHIHNRLSSRLRSTNSLWSLGAVTRIPPQRGEIIIALEGRNVFYPERSRGEGVYYLNTRTCPPLTAPPSFSVAPIATLVPSPEITTLLPQLSPAASPSISVFC